MTISFEIEGEDDPLPYKVHRILLDGVSNVYEKAFASLPEAQAYTTRRLDM